ncbi:uncharacterized protein TNCV_4207401 [Trichonephila clavipes]|nr:uncharacterized protein TNCV_4207401 [Trichonephila clavipes]
MAALLLSDPRSGRPSTGTSSHNVERVRVAVEQDRRLTGIVHHEYADTGQTINNYVEVLKRLRNAIRRKRPQLWESGDWLLHHDNAPAHTSNLVQQYLSKHSIAQLRQPPYSPDIASSLRLLAISSIEN